MHSENSKALFERELEPVATRHPVASPATNVMPQKRFKPTTIAHEVGAVALAGRKRGLTDVSTKSTSTDMVTEYDKLTEASIITALRSARPNDSIVGEEGGGRQGQRKEGGGGCKSARNATGTRGSSIGIAQ